MGSRELEKPLNPSVEVESAVKDGSNYFPTPNARLRIPAHPAPTTASPCTFPTHSPTTNTNSPLSLTSTSSGVNVCIPKLASSHINSIIIDFDFQVNHLCKQGHYLRSSRFYVLPNPRLILPSRKNFPPNTRYVYRHRKTCSQFNCLTTEKLTLLRARLISTSLKVHDTRTTCYGKRLYKFRIGVEKVNFGARGGKR